MSPLQLVLKASEFIAEQGACEGLLAELETSLTADYFTKLREQAYDVGAVMEELQETMEASGEQLSLPPYDKVSLWGDP